MSKTGRSHEEEAWSTAKRVCRLSGRQVEMARALRMNPTKLPGLRPRPQQRWKLPVGEFIEERYRKRFGETAGEREPRGPRADSRQPSAPREDAHAPGPVRDPTWQVQELICYLTNLADDLRQWLECRTVGPEVQRQLAGELREIADALESAAPIPEVSGIPIPSREARAASPRPHGRARLFDDDDVPF